MGRVIRMTGWTLIVLVWCLGVSPNLKAASSLTPTPQAEHVYKASEVTKKPVITFKPEAEYTKEARRNQVTGSVFLWVVFRADGEVADIRTRSGLPFGLTEKAMEAARKIKFEPGEKDGRPVSIRMIIEYEFRLPKS